VKEHSSHTRNKNKRKLYTPTRQNTNNTPLTPATPEQNRKNSSQYPNTSPRPQHYRKFLCFVIYSPTQCEYYQILTNKQKETNKQILTSTYKQIIQHFTYPHPPRFNNTRCRKPKTDINNSKFPKSKFSKNLNPRKITDFEIFYLSREKRGRERGGAAEQRERGCGWW
jgi:hypothetical protein